MNIQFSVKQNKFVSGHFIWNVCDNHLAQNSVVSPIPKGILSSETFCFIDIVEIIHCLFEV